MPPRHESDDHKLVWLEASGVWARIPSKEYPQATKKQLKTEDATIPTSTPRNFHPDCDGDENNCSICLDHIKLHDKAVLTSHTAPCMHEFHYDCIIEWLSHKQNCPLCKADISKIFYKIKQDGSHQELILPQSRPAPDPHRAEIMTRLAEILGVAGLIRNELHDLDLDHRHRRHSHSDGQRRQHRRNEPQHHPGREPRPYYTRVQRHSTSSSSLPLPPENRNDNNETENREEALLAWRRTLYDEDLWAISLGSATNANNNLPRSLIGGAHGRQRRVAQWIDRELQAVLETTDNSIVRGFVIGLLTTYAPSPPDHPRRRNNTFAAERDQGPVNLLRPFLGGRAAHFWHELCCFATAPAYTIETYDRIVKYYNSNNNNNNNNEDREEDRTRYRQRRRDDEEERRGDKRRSRDRKERRDCDDEEEEDDRKDRKRRRRRSRSRSRSHRRDDKSSKEEKKEQEQGDNNDSDDDRWPMWKWGDPIE